MGRDDNIDNELFCPRWLKSIASIFIRRFTIFKEKVLAFMGREFAFFLIGL